MVRLGVRKVFILGGESVSAYFQSANKTVVASGEKFADALAAVPYAAKNESPIILV